MSDDMFFDDEMGYTADYSSPDGMNDYSRAVTEDLLELWGEAELYGGAEWGQLPEPHPAPQLPEPHPAPPYYGDGLEDPDPPFPTGFMHPNYDPNAIHDPPIESEGLGPLDWVSPLTAPLGE
jgi:hypothetical protein